MAPINGQNLSTGLSTSANCFIERTAATLNCSITATHGNVTRWYNASPIPTWLSSLTFRR